MDNSDSIEGIGGDSKFADLLYLYYKMKDSLSNYGNNPSEEKENLERQTSVYYLATVDYCLKRIQQLPDGNAKRNYLDWLRWNMDVILAELEQYQVIPHLATLVTKINSCKDHIRAIAESYFQLSEAEKGISNEYTHTYERLSLPVINPGKAYIFAGKLLINYVNLLKNRFFIKKLDRDGMTFAQLDEEADYLATKLNCIDGRLSSDIKTTLEKYAEFRLMDDALRITGDKSIKQALEFAHKRATESALEAAIRKIRETITLIKLRLEKNLREVWGAATIPFRNPRKASRNLVLLFKNPKESVGQLWNWAKESPWKSATVILGGIVIGAVVGATMLAGPLILLDLAVVAVTIPSLIVGGVIGVTAAVGGFVIPVVAANYKAVQLKAEAIKNIATEKAKEVRLKAQNNMEGYRLAREAIFEETRREYIREAQKQADDVIRRIREEEKRAEEERERQINSMSPVELEAIQVELLQNDEELTAKLRDIQTEKAKSQKEFRQKQIDNWKVREGLAAASKIMQDIRDKTGSPSECSTDSADSCYEASNKK